MASVDFIYDPTCPNVPQARANLQAAFAHLGAEPCWLEWDTTDPATPAEFRELPSPSIWVNGRDVDADAPAASGRGCRIYVDGTVQSGVPSVALLVHALRDPDDDVSLVASTSPKGGWRRAFAVLPSLGIATVPVGLCPGCFAGYVGALGTMGLGFLLERRYLMPLAAVALLLALGSLAWRARTRRGFGPLALGVIGALVLWRGQFVADNMAATALGATTLLIAAAWNVWPRAGQPAGCAACEPGAHGVARSRIQS